MRRAPRNCCRGVSIVEVLVLVVIVSGLLIPLLTLSGRNVEDHQDQLDRALAQGLCLDVLERFKRFKPYWTMPGADGGAPLDEMFGPVELKPGQATLFDYVYLENMRALGMRPQPKIEKTPDPTHFGLFRLDVSVAWKSAKGRDRSVKYSRWCYAP